MNVQQLQRRADKASTYQPVCMKHFKVQKERCQAPQHGDLSFQSSLTLDNMQLKVC